LRPARIALSSTATITIEQNIFVISTIHGSHMGVEGQEVAEGLHVHDQGGLTERPYRTETGRNPTMAHVKIRSSHRRVTVAESRRNDSRIQRGRQA